MFDMQDESAKKVDWRHRVDGLIRNATDGTQAYFCKE